MASAFTTFEPFSRDILEKQLLDLYLEVQAHYKSFDESVDLRAQLTTLKAKLEQESGPAGLVFEEQESIIAAMIFNVVPSEMRQIDAGFNISVAQVSAQRKAYYTTKVSRWIERLDSINLFLKTSKEKPRPPKDCAICLYPIEKLL